LGLAEEGQEPSWLIELRDYRQ